jgi:hypothetical protein
MLTRIVWNGQRIFDPSSRQKMDVTCCSIDLPSDEAFDFVSEFASTLGSDLGFDLISDLVSDLESRLTEKEPLGVTALGVSADSLGAVVLAFVVAADSMLVLRLYLRWPTGLREAVAEDAGLSGISGDGDGVSGDGGSIRGDLG